MTKFNRLLIIGFVIALNIFTTNNIKAQTKRALFIGIDIYNPPANETVAMVSNSRGISKGEWMDLDGCVNDAKAVKEVLMSRYEFKEENTAMIMNQECSRERILGEFEKLLNSSKKGDMVVIYYAGHGSQVKNSLSDESDKEDETMVPADVWNGTKDIRDKELAKIFQSFADKGVILTVIYDSCHSGSIGRGKLSDDTPKLRWMIPDPSDAKDGSISPKPENNGVLIISAAQDFEFASEQKDENGSPHGAFTVALLQTLKSASVNAKTSDIFNSIRAIMKYNGKTQEPVLAGNDDRKNKTIFGYPQGSISGKTLVPVIKPQDKDNIVFQGGYASGLNINCELIKMVNKDTIAKIKITQMKGVNSCVGQLVKGDIGNVKPGDMFELASWSTANGPNLKVYVPKTTYNYNDLASIAKQLSTLKNNKSIKWISDPSAEAPTHTVFYTGTEWMLGFPDGKNVSLGKSPTEKAVSSKLKNGDKLFVSLPPTTVLKDQIMEGYKINTAVEASQSGTDAQYYLTGRWENNQIEYAYVIPQVTVLDTNRTNTLPVRTDFIKLNAEENKLNLTSDSLQDFTLKLAKIKAWLTLSNPPDDGAFPFNLAIKKGSSKNLLTNGTVYKGDTLSLMLVSDKENISYWDGSKRYIYVFVIDSKGTTCLLYPRQGSVENQFPRIIEGDVPKEMALGRTKLMVSEPFGMDSYIMLTTDEPLPNPSALEMTGVRTRGIDKGGLSGLLNVGAATRGQLLTPASWSINRVMIASKPK
ncbi:MAG: caspase family protein [Bacteroidetes bacterium]|nr:caspase family protein [Bacteroidota bacterium]